MRKSLITLSTIITIAVVGTTLYSANNKHIKNANSAIINTTQSTNNSSTVLKSQNIKTVKTINQVSENTTSNKKEQANLNSTKSNSANTYSKLSKDFINSPLGKVAIVTNLNDYKIINGVKYYNVYQYLIDSSKNGWNFDGNYSNFIGALYTNENGQKLNTQFVQNYSSMTLDEKKSQIEAVAKQFASNFNYGDNISINMNKSINFEGYTCYLVTMGSKSFYMNPAGYIYISKNQKFY